MPSRSIAARTRSGWPAAATPGSVTSSARRTPRRASSQPASSAAPAPNLIGVASTVKTVSWSGAGGMRDSVSYETVPFLDDLRSLVGADHVLTDPELRAPYETDWTGRFGAPAA